MRTNEQIIDNEVMGQTIDQMIVEEIGIDHPDEATDNEDTDPVKEKATRILRARLPHLSDAGLNFERRSGNFFTATIETTEDGTEKVRRLVVDDEAIPAEAIDEATAKRHARILMNEDREWERLIKEIERCEEALRDAQADREDYARLLDEARATVEGFCLPEREKKPKRLSALVEAQTAAERAQAEAARLRALLTAAGIDPDAAE